MVDSAIFTHSIGDHREQGEAEQRCNGLALSRMTGRVCCLTAGDCVTVKLTFRHLLCVIMHF